MRSPPSFRRVREKSKMDTRVGVETADTTTTSSTGMQALKSILMGKLDYPTMMLMVCEGMIFSEAHLMFCTLNCRKGKKGR